MASRRREAAAQRPKSKSKPAEKPRELSTKAGFPIVGVGASAGGLEAFTQLLKNLPRNPGMAFVLVQHLAPAHESLLSELLSKTTAMPVREVEDGMKVERDTVYVIPPRTEINIVQRTLHLSPREPRGEQYLPFDTFLESLAKDRQSVAIAVIMSGTGSDGSNGVRAIKAGDGIVFAQDESAKFDGMPKNAIATGMVDFVLPPDRIAAELVRISRHLPGGGGWQAGEPAEEIVGKHDELRGVFSVLGRATGVDFSLYKGSTIVRRMKRRMLLLKLETIGDYVSYLEANPSEVEILYQEILINVTSFFREPTTFEALKRLVFPEIVQKGPDDVPVRIWVPGCSTGEEVFSIAISFLEFMGDKITPNVQIFGTDIDDKAVEKARRGIYPENIVKDISPERLKRFFEKQEGGGYAVKKAVREMCIFARQNLVKDPPFSKMDLISCRNVLIYFGRELQEKAVRILFYALNQKGFLLSGASETMGLFESFFSTVDKKSSIYSRKTRSERPPVGTRDEILKPATFPAKGAVSQNAVVSDPRKEADAIVLHRYGPPGFVVSEDLEVLQFRGDTGPYLRPAPGKASLNLLKLVYEDFLIELRTAIHQAKKDDLPVRKEKIAFVRKNETRHVSIDVIPFTSAGERCFLVLFDEGAEPVAAEAHKKRLKGGGTARHDDEKTRRLQEELASVKQHFKAMAEKYESAEEELRALNEELQSHNEEMQSVNEELQTSSEELQSTNEELNTVNDELMSRNEETTHLNDDLVNVLRGVEIPIVRLDGALQIKRFNETAGKLMNLIAADIGRPIRNIRMNIDIPDLEEMAFDVIDSLAPKEKEVSDTSGRWYSLTIRPYRTGDNRIDGVLMTLVDIDNMKRTLLRIKEAYDYANAIVETVREPLIVLDAELRVITANKSFYTTFFEAPEDTEGRHINELGNGQWNIPELMKQLREVLPDKKSFSDFKVTAEFPNLGLRTMLLNARKIQLEGTYSPTAFNVTEHLDRLILLAIEDTTLRMKSEEQIRQLNDSLEHRARDLELAYHDMESFGYSISHDLRAPLRIIKSMSDIVLNEQYEKLDEEGKKLLKRINLSAERMDQLVAALLELSKAGRQEIHATEIDMDKEAATVAEDLRASAPERNITMTVKKLPPASGDLTLMRQVLTNLLSNAVKFTRDKDPASIEVGGRHEVNENLYYVKDNGAGFEAAYADKLFNAFQRLHSSEDFEGIGIGLSIVQRIIQRHGGRVWAEGETGKGATFYFTLPSKA